MKQLSKHTDKQKQTETKIWQTTVLTNCVSGGAFWMSFVSNLFFSVEEVGACLELSFARQGSQVSCFPVAFESLQLESRRNSSISRGACWQIFTVRLLWSLAVELSCFKNVPLMWTLWIRLGAPAKRAVEKFPVSPFHLENGGIKHWIKHSVKYTFRWTRVTRKPFGRRRWNSQILFGISSWYSSEVPVGNHHTVAIRNVNHNLCPEAQLAHSPEKFTWMYFWIPLGAHGFLWHETSWVKAHRDRDASWVGSFGTASLPWAHPFFSFRDDMASLHSGSGGNCPGLLGPLQLDGWGWWFWKGWQAQQVAHCSVDAANEWAPGDVAWSTPLLSSDHLAGGCMLTSRYLRVPVLCLCCLEGRGPPRPQWCDGFHRLRTCSAVFHGTATERHVAMAMVDRPGARCIFVPVHTSLPLDLVCFWGYIPGRGGCCDFCDNLRYSLWRFCLGNEVILQLDRSMVPLLALGTFRTLWISLHLLCSWRCFPSFVQRHIPSHSCCHAHSHHYHWDVGLGTSVAGNRCGNLARRGGSAQHEPNGVLQR